MQKTDDITELTKLQEELAVQKRENEKLEKINAALMYRMEEGGFNHHSYRAFEHSVQLSEKVNQKTDELQSVLQKLAQSNADLEAAHDETNRVKQRLNDAIESTNQAMVLLDKLGAIIFFNRHFETVWDDLSITPHIGDNYHDITQAAKHSGVIRRALPANAEGCIIYQLSNRRWYQVTNRRTQEGGQVILFNDITDVKLNESNRYEQVIKEKNKLLQSLIDNIEVGILLIHQGGEIAFWNDTFLSQSNLPVQLLINCRNIYALQNCENWSGLNLQTDADNIQIISDDLVVERNITVLPDGNTLCTFTNITSQHHHAETMKQNENWIRMITDNVPALIAYIGTDKKFQYTNKGYRDWYGVSESDIAKHPMENSHLKDVYPNLVHYLKRVSKGEVVSFQSRERNAVGELGFLQKVYLPHFDSEGTIAGHFVLATDISEQVKSKLALEAAKDQLETNVEKRTRELNHANVALQDAIKSKSRFLAAISHDLMQPLSAAILFNESLKDQIDSSANTIISALDNSLRDLHGLIRTLIETSKLDAGALQPDKQAENALPLLSQLAEEFSHISKDYKVDFHYRFHEAFVFTDLNLLSRILRNLLINAMKYGANGKVLFIARKVKDNLKISILDQGVGISEVGKGLIFKEFSRLENSFNYSYSLGLGLYIVDKMSKLLGHEIHVKSEENVGACFTVCVPITEDSVEEKISSDHLKENQTALPASLLNKQIWHIDNDTNMRIAMQSLFDSWGMEVDTFSGYQQCNMVTNGNFEGCDLLIIDYHLDNNENGLEIAKKIRERRPFMPIIICTANRSKQLADEVSASNLKLLYKPIDAQTLKTSLISCF